MLAGTPIIAEDMVSISADDLQDLPSFSLHIPDFEGSASIRIIANSTQTELACFRAVMRNGATLSHPAIISSILGTFALIAFTSSFAVAVYGGNLLQLRIHQGHVLPVLVVFELFQAIFFSSALDLNWPSICAAWWSNFAWSAGLIPATPIIGSINHFVGVSGNSSQQGAAGSTIINNNGGLQQQQLLGRSLGMAFDSFKHHKRTLVANTGTEAYSWSGTPVAPGLPNPGNWTGFAGELQELEIPVKDAFLLGLIWLAVLLVGVLALIASSKALLEGLSYAKCIKSDRMSDCRRNWATYLGLAAARLCFIAFPMLMILSISQLALMGQIGVTAIAAIVFILAFTAGFGVVGYACYYRLHLGKVQAGFDKLCLQGPARMKWHSSLGDEEKSAMASSTHLAIPMFKIQYTDNSTDRAGVHEDEAFIKRFGWLTSHFRQHAWWFFAAWVVYQFVRACFIGGASAHPAVQVIGLFVVELIVMLVNIWTRPFEGFRNAAIAVYILTLTRVITAGLSIAFLPSYNFARVPATIVGIVIIVFQGLACLSMMVLILIGVAGSWLSLTRYKEACQPHQLAGVRDRYFRHLDSMQGRSAGQLNRPSGHSGKESSGFTVKTVRRAPKIVDDNAFQEKTAEPPLPPKKVEHMAGIPEDEEVVQSPPAVSTNPHRRRGNSMRSSHSMSNANIPAAARMHRMSWTSRDFGQIDDITEITSGTDNESGVGRQVSRRATMISQPESPIVSVVRPVASLSSIRPSTTDA